MRFAAVGCVLSAHAADLPGDELPKWVLDLSRIQRSMRTELKRLPNYTCAETIARYEGDGNHPHLIDRIETHVAVTRERELYSWQGGPFEERSIIDMVHEGFISDGDFSAMLRNVFEGRNARISFMGEETLDGRKALRYRFEIPQAISQWVIRAGTAAGTVGARGSFWADAGTLDLLKMEFSAVDLPMFMYGSSLEESITYVRTRIADRDVLLPSVAEKRTDANRAKYLNRAVFRDCREFAAQSTITFGGEDESLVALPAKLNLELRLDTEIDTGSAATGSAAGGCEVHRRHP
jgi:hypothetical protein